MNLPETTFNPFVFSQCHLNGLTLHGVGVLLLYPKALYFYESDVYRNAMRQDTGREYYQDIEGDISRMTCCIIQL